jgi:hypothetical protein
MGDVIGPQVHECIRVTGHRVDVLYFRCFSEDLEDVVFVHVAGVSQFGEGLKSGTDLRVIEANGVAGYDALSLKAVDPALHGGSRQFHTRGDVFHSASGIFAE